MYASDYIVSNIALIQPLCEPQKKPQRNRFGSGNAYLIMMLLSLHENFPRYLSENIGSLGDISKCESQFRTECVPVCRVRRVDSRGMFRFSP
jgi:hypothetical protein